MTDSCSTQLPVWLLSVVEGEEEGAGLVGLKRQTRRHDDVVVDDVIGVADGTFEVEVGADPHSLVHPYASYSWRIWAQTVE